MKSSTANPRHFITLGKTKRGAAFALLAIMLAGCDLPPGLFGGLPHMSEKTQDERTESTSLVIASLQSRGSVSKDGSVCKKIEQITLENASVNSKETLRIRRLEAESRSKNWLPQIGPDVSLTSLGNVVGSILVDLVLYDTGGKRAERELAVADVELAAVGYAIELNDLVAEAIIYNIEMSEIDAEIAISKKEAAKLKKYLEIARTRIAGGLSDSSDEKMLSIKIAEVSQKIEALNARRQATSDQLALIAPGVEGLANEVHCISLPTSLPTSLRLEYAKAESNADLSEAMMLKAGLLPSIKAQSRITSEGVTGGVGLGLGAPIGIGTPSNIQKAKALTEAATKRLANTEREIARKMAKQDAEKRELKVQRDSNSSLLRNSEEIYYFAEQQYDLGRKSLADLTISFQNFNNLQREDVRIDHEIARIEVRQAADAGLLADGSNI